MLELAARRTGKKRIAVSCVGRLSILLTLLLGLASCGASDHSAASNVRVRTYKVRGQVVTVPVPNNPASELMIHHESIPGFVNKSGEAVGMESMTMSFTPAKGLSLSGIKAGDKVEFVLSVNWPDNRIQITKLNLLPADTKLNFGGKMSHVDADQPK